jgi:hypothetical protein
MHEQHNDATDLGLAMPPYRTEWLAVALVVLAFAVLTAGTMVANAWQQFTATQTTQLSQLQQQQALQGQQALQAAQTQLYEQAHLQRQAQQQELLQQLTSR